MKYTKKKNIFFNHAFEAWTGHKWEWKKEDGSRNDPIDSEDETIRAFYTGFCLARKGQEELLEYIRKLNFMKKEMTDMEKQLNKFKKEDL